MICLSCIPFHGGMRFEGNGLYAFISGVVVHRLVEAGEERLDCIDALAVIVGILIKSD